MRSSLDARDRHGSTSDRGRSRPYLGSHCRDVAGSRQTFHPVGVMPTALGGCAMDPMPSRRQVLAVAAAVAASATVAARRPGRVPSFPPGPEAITAGMARERAAALLAQPRVRRQRPGHGPRPGHLDSRRAAPPRSALLPADARRHRGGATTTSTCSSTATSPATIGTTFLDALAAKVAEAASRSGSSVDAIGSEVDFGSKELFRDLRRGRRRGRRRTTASMRLPRGASSGPGDPPTGSRTPSTSTTARWSSSTAVIGYVGGTRHRGPLQRRALLRRHVPGHRSDRGPAPARLPRQLAQRRRRSLAADDDALDRWFPAATLDVPVDAGLQRPHDRPVERAGHGSSPDQRCHRGSRSTGRPNGSTSSTRTSATGRSWRALLAAAAARACTVRLVAPGKPTPPYPAAAFRHHYERLLDAGVEILLHPEMAHAKVLRIDDRVFIGGCNLDDLVAVPERRARSAVRGPRGRRADRAERSSTSSSRCPSRPRSRRVARTRAWNAAMDRDLAAALNAHTAGGRRARRPTEPMRRPSRRQDRAE